VTKGAAAAACVLSVVYAVVIMHFAINVPVADEWTSVVPLVNSAIHGSLTFGELWVQHFNESHLFIPNSIFAAVGVLGSFNTRILIALSVIFQVASFGVVLGLFKSYLGRTLSVVPVVVVGLGWFGLGAIDNALWGFQLQLYLTQFFVILMLFFLLAGLKRQLRGIWPFVAAVLCAIAASLSTIQGLLAWPLGLLVLVWSATRLAPYRRNLLLWCGTAIIAIGVYFIGYNSDLAHAGCFATSQECAASYGLHHLGSVSVYVLALLGNIIPASDGRLIGGAKVYVPVHQVLGGVFLAAAIFVAIRSYQQRRSGPASWVPVTLVIFGLLWDLSIAFGRVGEGIGTALGSHFVSPQILLFTGIVMSAFFEFHRMGTAGGVGAPERRATVGMLAAVGLLITVTVVALSSQVGIENGRFDRGNDVLAARVLANLNRLPRSARSCDIDFTVDDGLLSVGEAADEISKPLGYVRSDHLSLFQPNQYRHYRQLGPPVIARCL
jgi:hypothetical protein